MKRVAIYCRVSTQEQSEKGFSISEQKEKLINYCKNNSFIISDIYIDPGFSGADIERPALQRLISEVNNFDTVLVYRLDRLSRKVLDACRLVEEIFHNNKITFLSLTENIDTSTPNGLMIFHMIASVAQNERETIKERTQSGRRARAKTGLYHGGGFSPIGYDYVDGKLIINEFEALQVKEIFSLYLQGVSVRKISEKMTESKYTHKHGDWKYCKTVKTTLTNIIYTGKVIFDGNIYKALHEPIVSEEDFNTVQSILRGRIENKRKIYVSTSLLTGFLFCGICGSRYCKVAKKAGNTDIIITFVIREIKRWLT